MRFGANYDTKYTEAFETTQTGRDKAIQATLIYEIGSRPCPLSPPDACAVDGGKLRE
jgi:hypothetical protein